MGIIIQLLLPIICVLVAEGHVIDPTNLFYNHPHREIKNLKESEELSNTRPINGDIFSYNTQHAYSRMYHDNDFVPDMNMFPYFEFQEPFDMGNMGNMDSLPYGLPNIHNEFNIPGHYQPNHMAGMEDYKNTAKKTEHSEVNPTSQINSNEKPNQKQEDKSPVDSKKIDDISPKTNKIETDNKDKTEENNKKVNLNPKKDYLLVGNNGNDVFLLHENMPNVNTMTVPNNNIPISSKIVYVPYNPQQTPNPVYQLVNGQPPASILLTSNKLDLNNVVAPVQSQSNSVSSYVLLYANGQLIQIPGIAINSPPPVQFENQGSNLIVTNSNIPTPNYVYTKPQNQGNSQTFLQVSSTVPLTNNVPNTAILMQNPQVPNNIVTVNSQSNSIPQQSIAQTYNLNNGYVQPNVIPNVGNQRSIVSIFNPIPAGSIYNQGVQPVYVQANFVPNNGNQGSVNTVNPNASGSINAPGIQPALSFPVNNNQNNYQPLPAKEKDANAASPSNAAITDDQPGNMLLVEQMPKPNDNAIDLNKLEVQPAVMVSRFKEADAKNDKKKDKKHEKNYDKKN